MFFVLGYKPRCEPDDDVMMEMSHRLYESLIDGETLDCKSVRLPRHDAFPEGSTGFVYVTFSTATFSFPSSSFRSW